MLRVEVRDDGVGGADPSGHGLVGLGDRVTAIGGQLVVEGPAAAWTGTPPISSPRKSREPPGNSHTAAIPSGGRCRQTESRVAVPGQAFPRRSRTATTT
jgi:hypothetical protein